MIAIDFTPADPRKAIDWIVGHYPARRMCMIGGQYFLMLYGSDGSPINKMRIFLHPEGNLGPDPWRGEFPTEAHETVQL